MTSETCDVPETTVVDPQAAATALGRLAGAVAHEIRNPLNSMTLQLAALRVRVGDAMPAHVDRTLAALDLAIEDLDRIVALLLDYLRPAPLALEDTDLNALLREVLAPLRPDAEARAVRIDLALARDLPPVRLDRTAIGQALTSLVRNALEATPPGGVVALESVEAGDAVRVRVADTGEGIEPERREEIFQLFRTTKKGGRGVGLSMAERLAGLHGGSIALEPSAGPGAVFVLRLPRAAGAA
jgi:signal transduction histidine kinase